MTYSELITAARTYAETGEDGLGDGSMNWSNATYDDEYKDFWKNYTLVTGRPAPEDDDGFFECMC